MHLDVQKLRDFYYRSALGREVQRALRNEIAKIWPDCKGQTIVGYGFAVPLLRPFLAISRRVIGVMPGPQGVMHWPVNLPNLAVLCDETAWPLETGHVDRLIILHGLETSDRVGELLEEVHRVLGPGGRALFIVPNRTGMWSRSDRTPFGFGRPYSAGQLETVLRIHDFVLERQLTALFIPPSHRRFWLRSAALWDRIGKTFGPSVAGGVRLVEVSKRPVRTMKVRESQKILSALDVIEELTEPQAEPARGLGM